MVWARLGSENQGFFEKKELVAAISKVSERFSKKIKEFFRKLEKNH